MLENLPNNKSPGDATQQHRIRLSTTSAATAAVIIPAAAAPGRAFTTPPSSTSPHGPDILFTPTKHGVTGNDNTTVVLSKSNQLATSASLSHHVQPAHINGTSSPLSISRRHLLLASTAAALPYDEAISKSDTPLLSSQSGTVVNQAARTLRLNNNKSSHVAFRLTDQPTSTQVSESNDKYIQRPILAPSSSWHVGSIDDADEKGDVIGQRIAEDRKAMGASTTSPSSSVVVASYDQPQVTDELRLQPFAHQVGGQSTVLAVDSSTICKPMISREARFYQRVPSGLTPFIPQYKGELKVRFVRQNSGVINFVAMDPDPKLGIRRVAARAKSTAVLSEIRDQSCISNKNTTASTSNLETSRKLSAGTAEESLLTRDSLLQDNEPPYRSRCFSCSSNVSTFNPDVPSISTGSSSHEDIEDDDGDEFSSTSSPADSDRRQSSSSVNIGVKNRLASKRHSAIPASTSAGLAGGGLQLTVPSLRSAVVGDTVLCADSFTDSPLVHSTITAAAPVSMQAGSGNVASHAKMVATGTLAKPLRTPSDGALRSPPGGQQTMPPTTVRSSPLRSKSAHGSTNSLPAMASSPPDAAGKGAFFSGLKSWSEQCQERTFVKLGVQVGVDDVKKFILLENVASKYQIPCVLDLKMGTRQYGDDADEEKRRKQIAKCEATTSKTLGVRACGMQVYRHDQGRYITWDKYYGRSLTVDGFKQALSDFLDNGIRIRTDVIPALLTKLRRLQAAVANLDSFRFYSSSLLLIYDGRESPSPLSSKEAPFPREMSLSSPDHGVEFEADADGSGLGDADDESQRLMHAPVEHAHHHKHNDCSCCCKCRCACHKAIQNVPAASRQLNVEITAAAAAAVQQQEKLSKTRMWKPIAPLVMPPSSTSRDDVTVKVLEAEAANETLVDVKMIDFAHTSLPRALRTPQNAGGGGGGGVPPSPSASSSVSSSGALVTEQHQGPDAGYMFGLSNLIDMFEELWEREEEAQEFLSTAGACDVDVPSTPPLSAGIDDKSLTAVDDQRDLAISSPDAAIGYADDNNNTHDIIAAVLNDAV